MDDRPVFPSLSKRSLRTKSKNASHKVLRKQSGASTIAWNSVAIAAIFFPFSLKFDYFY
ncbi:MAG: hypothetical protein AAGA60_29295 [Cyanobacteria bacterium P01_E01_bin.42]